MAATTGRPPDPHRRAPVAHEPVCRVDQIPVSGGVAALVHGTAIALIRTDDGAVHALSNYDPFGRGSVLSRGIVGTRTVGEEEVPFVASLLHKHAFDLRTGACLEDDSVHVSTYEVRIVDGVVLVGARRRHP